MSSPLSYVRQLKIASPAGDAYVKSASKLEAIAAADGDQGFVDAGSLVSFVDKIGKQDRYDVLNSTLLAQLAADYQFDRKKQTKEWFNYYVEVLSNVGWVLQNFQFEEYKTSGQTMQISSAIIEIIKGIVSGDELDAVMRTFDSLKDSANEPWWVVFSHESSGPSSTGNFQVLPCKVDSSGQVVMGMGCFYFTATATEERWLWFKYSTTSISMFRGTQVSTLNKNVYDQVRQEVIEKLGSNAKKFIGDLKIKKEEK